jgi:hypothetical protein
VVAIVTVAPRLAAAADDPAETHRYWGDKDIARVGYRNGVPTGGALTHAPQRAEPSFLIHAVKDPLSGNLDANIELPAVGNTLWTTPPRAIRLVHASSRYDNLERLGTSRKRVSDAALSAGTLSC